MDANTNDLIVISVIAKDGTTFAAYDLLQAILATKMKYGPMNIFHYYSSTTDTKPLFSLCSLTEPGDFDWDKLGNFSCAGLCLFMNTKNVSNPEEIFALMVATAEQLADDLDGELRGGQSSPWTEDEVEKIQVKFKDNPDFDKTLYD